jgi:hypothetical protein
VVQSSAARARDAAPQRAPLIRLGKTPGKNPVGL